MSKISPSILAADFTNLQAEIKKIEATDADRIHFDIMDHDFVPNLTFGPMLIKQLRGLSGKHFEAHLMVKNPENYVEECKEAGVDTFIFHAEATFHHDSLLQKIKNTGMQAGIALNPSTNPEVLKFILHSLDLILIMTVNPGFGGQSFLASQLPKVTLVKEMVKGLKIAIEVDGGVTNNTALGLKKAGADILVAGSYIFSDNDYQKQINKLKTA